MQLNKPFSFARAVGALMLTVMLLAGTQALPLAAADEPALQDANITDLYGILQMPHSFAVKLVKLPDAHGYIETYRHEGDEYVFSRRYEVTYPKEGQKSRYGDLKTVGGNVVRYMYRTTRSKMNGWNQEGQKFGVYKVSYPMPHDALPYLEAGKMSRSQFEKIPAINKRAVAGGEEFFPHPQGLLGADILIHTAKKGSLGCINVKNEEMSELYLSDLTSQNDRELIPLVIYDEGIQAPPEGILL